MSRFRFKQFEIDDRGCGMKIGTDGVLLGAWALAPSPTASFNDSPLRVLDVGTGSGLIALMLAQRLGNAQITGVEINPEAASAAASNFALSPWSARLFAVNEDFLKFSERDLRFDAVVSNPPFFSNGTNKTNNPDPLRHSARHDDTLTLEKLFHGSSAVLNPQGRLALILPTDRERDARFLSEFFHFSLSRRTEVVTAQGKPPKRVLLEYVLRPCAALNPENTVLTLTATAPASYSPQYAALVRDFYLAL